VGRHLLGGRRSLQREQSSTDPGQRQAPARESVDGCHRPGGHHVGRFDLSDKGARDRFLGPPAQYLDPSAETQLPYRLGQERGAPGERLDQYHGEVGPRDSQNNAR
jgi:hypothetical protein